jgi:hypothetical protein
MFSDFAYNIYTPYFSIGEAWVAYWSLYHWTLLQRWYMIGSSEDRGSFSRINAIR